MADVVNVVRERALGVLLADTSRRLAASLLGAHLSTPGAMAVLVGIMAFASPFTRFVNVAEFTALLSAAFVFLVQQLTQPLPADAAGPAALGPAVYSLFILALLMSIYTLPRPLRESQAAQRSVGVLAFLGGAQVAQTFARNRAVAALVALGLGKCINLQRSAFPDIERAPVVVQASAPLLRQAVTTLAITAFFTLPHYGSIAQDVVFCLVVVGVAHVVVIMMHGEHDWKSFALWRIADHITQSLAQLPGNSRLHMAFLTLALGFLVTPLRAQLRLQWPAEYTDLVFLLAASTSTRYILSVLDSLAWSDVLLLRLVFFLTLPR